MAHVKARGGEGLFETCTNTAITFAAIRLSRRVAQC
jgi:hypothetical protein